MIQDQQDEWDAEIKHLAKLRFLPIAADRHDCLPHFIRTEFPSIIKISTGVRHHEFELTAVDQRLQIGGSSDQRSFDKHHWKRGPS